MTRRIAGMIGMALMLGLLIGCSQGKPARSGSAHTSAGASTQGDRFVLKAEPAGAAGVVQVRAQAKDQDDVVIVGRIGGSENPWVKGRAAFSIVDPAIKSCLECGSECPKPWDYC